MKSIVLTLLILFALGTKGATFQTNNINGRTYYLDGKAGNDKNDGLSEKKPWKSLLNIKQLVLKPGDKILLRRGTSFVGTLEIKGSGTSENRIIIDAYGIGKKPTISAPDHSLYTILIENSDYITLKNIEIQNKGTERMAYRTGVKVLCREYGISHNIELVALDIHDVNGSLIKHDGGGSGILIENKWTEKVSVFDSLLIENCAIKRCERNGIIWSAPWDRKKWHPSTHTVVRKNLIEEVPGDGIVPIGCDSALVEYNLMRNCTDLLDIKEAAAGIWPWSCDNTIIQYNEVSDHKAPWDGQGFDSDFNCTNTTIQYNYSHDNQGGFVLICNAGNTDPTTSIGNIGSLVQYNISVNDGIRSRKTHAGTFFSPTIHIGGPCKKTIIKNNILHVNKKPDSNVERTLIASEDWDGYADDTKFIENLFYVAEPSEIRLTQSTQNLFEKNYYLGSYKNVPEDRFGKSKSIIYKNLLKNDPTGFNALSFLFMRQEVGDGQATLNTIEKSAVKRFFDSLK